MHESIQAYFAFFGAIGMFGALTLNMLCDHYKSNHLEVFNAYFPYLFVAFILGLAYTMSYYGF